MKPINHRPVGRRIFTLRKRQRITQTELAAWLRARRVPITRDIIANWETGRVAVPAYCLQLLACSLGVRIADILPDLTIKGVIAGQITRSSISRRRNWRQNDH